jgi:hypothetical protein
MGGSPPGKIKERTCPFRKKSRNQRLDDFENKKQNSLFNLIKDFD